MTKFKAIHEALIAGQPLREEHRDHKLSGNWKNHRECHIEPDWLLIYRTISALATELIDRDRLVNGVTNLINS